MKSNKKLSLIVTAACALMALLLVISWFLPVAKIYGDSYTMLQVLEKANQDGAAIGYWFFVILCAVSVLWAAIPKKWAAIVGMIYSILPIILCAAQVSDWKANDIDLAIGGSLLVPCAVLVLVLSVAKLVVMILESKKPTTPAV